jgi:RHS repeat-associated protein
MSVTPPAAARGARAAAALPGGIMRPLGEAVSRGVSMPSGGGTLRGMGEQYQADAFTGAATLSLPLGLTAARWLSPGLSIDYNSSAGNGAFGIGFELSLGAISRRTSQGVPLYDDSDTFMLGNAVLVPDAKGPASRVVAGTPYEVLRFWRRVEDHSLRVERWQPAGGPAGTFWRVIDSDNTIAFYGLSSSARIADPTDPTRVLSWLQEQHVSCRGEAMLVAYKSEDTANVAAAIFERGREQTANRYASRISYGNVAPVEPGAGGFVDLSAAAWTYEVVLDYGEYDLRAGNDLPWRPARPWAARLDPFSSYAAGFEIRTHRLCRNVLMFHRFPAQWGADPVLVRSVALRYDENPLCSRLIGVGVTGWRYLPDQPAGQRYRVKAMPETTFGYSDFAPAGRTFVPMRDATDAPLIAMSAPPDYELEDLYGEGLPGVLYRDGTSVRYWSPVEAHDDGAAIRYTPELVASAPPQLRSPLAPLLDLASDGRPGLVVGRGSATAFSAPLAPERRWSPPAPLRAQALVYGTQPWELADLSGSGWQDLVAVGRESITFHPSLGAAGFAPAVTVPRPSDLPVADPDEGLSLVGFADLLGGGSPQRYRITDGAVEVWPSLGGGRFAPRVLMGNAPVFGPDFDPGRLFLADLDGSGTADIIYVRGNRIDVYFNQAGNSFTSTALTVALPTAVTNGRQVSVADVFGSGCHSVVVRQDVPNAANWACDLSAGTKPYLLNVINDALGNRVTLTYASSARFYLEDKAAGRPWVTSLPFPVAVVAKIEAADQVSGSVSASTFAYHDGYYDRSEREFRGFGFVEQIDVETPLEAKKPAAWWSLAPQSGPAGVVAPCLTRHWFHLGAWKEQPALIAAYAAEFFGGDPQACPQLQPRFDLGSGGVSALREAWWALAGTAMRTEVYGVELDNPDRIPYSVGQYASDVVLLQPADPAAGRRYAVFAVQERESLAATYDGVADDPKVSHDFVLAYDAYGNVVRGCTVAYARRPGAGDRVPGQAIQYATCAAATFLPPQDLPDIYLVDLTSEQKSWQLANLAAPTLRGLYYGFDDIAAQVAAALAGGTKPSATLLAWTTAIYLGASGGETPAESAAPQALVLRNEQAVFDAAALATLFSGQPVPGGLDDFLAGVGGYRHDATNALWWGTTDSTRYATLQGFFQPVETRDPFARRGSGRSGTVVTIAYDPAWLFATGVTSAGRDKDVLALTTTVDAIDYAGPRARRITAPNGEVHEFAFDPLGRVVAASHRGTQWRNGAAQPVGFTPITDAECFVWPEPASMAALIASPQDYLKGAAGFFWTDLDAFAARRGPICAASLTASEFPAQPAQPTGEVRIAVTYQDGFGRTAATKVKAEADPAAPNDARWRTTGQVRYTNKGDPFVVFPPYFSASYQYVAGEVGPGLPSVRYYDALGRCVRATQPAGTMQEAFFSTFDYGPWSETVADQNDTIKASPYYQYYIVEGHDLPAWEKDALTKAAAFADTPTTTRLDALGHPIEVVRRLSPQSADELVTVNTFTIQGWEVSTADPRLAAAGVTNNENTYNLAGTPIRIASADAGTSFSLDDVIGRRIYGNDARGTVAVPQFDSYHRRTAVSVWPGSDVPDRKGDASALVVERMIYGDSLDSAGNPPIDNPAARNLIGELAVTFDSTGRLDTVASSIDERPLETRRRIRTAYQGSADWTAASGLTWPQLFAALDGQLSSETLVSTVSYNAVGQIVSSTDAAGNTTRSTFYVSALTSGTWLTPSGGTERQVVAKASYAANQQRLSTSYVNSDGAAFMTSVRSYDPSTFRLTGIVTTRLKDGQTLQDLGYYHDPVGNLTHVTDAGAPSQLVFSRQQAVSPDQDFAYDALYRLMQSKGRALRSMTFNQYAAGDYQPYFPGGTGGDLTSVDNYTLSYAYDAGDNLVTTRFVSPSSSWTSTLTVDARSNRAALTAAPGDPLAGYFDPNGNLLKTTRVNPLAWSWHNQLASVTFVERAAGDTSDAEYYSYARTGGRMRKVATFQAAANTRIVDTLDLGPLSIERVTVGTTLTEELRRVRVMDDEHARLERLVWTVGSPPDGVANPQERYQLDNIVGSAVLEVDGSGSMISYEEYAAFGSTMFATGASLAEVSLKRYRHAGRERDQRTGFYYYGARYYAPWAARWLSPDPAGMVDGTNVYAFLSNNPAASVDLGGMVNKKNKKTTGKGKKKGVKKKSTGRDKFDKMFGKRLTTEKLYLKLQAGLTDWTKAERREFIKLATSDKDFRKRLHDKVRVKAKKGKKQKRSAGLDEIFKTSETVNFFKRAVKEEESSYIDMETGEERTYNVLDLQQQVRVPTALVLTKEGEGHSGALYTSQTGQSGMTTGQAALHEARQDEIEASSTPEEALVRSLVSHYENTPNDATIQANHTSGFDTWGNDFSTAQGKQRGRDIQGTARNMLKDQLEHLRLVVDEDVADLIPPMSPRYVPSAPVPEIEPLGESTSFSLIQFLPKVKGTTFSNFT